MRNALVHVVLFVRQFVVDHKVKIAAAVAPVMLAQVAHFAPKISVNGHAYNPHLSLSLVEQAVISGLTLLSVHKASK